MSQPIRILAFAGSLRQDSYNKKLVKIAVSAATAAGANVTYLDLRDYPLPIFDEDLEKPQACPTSPASSRTSSSPATACSILPQYNSSITAVLKNTIDWVSRPVQGEPPLNGFKGKIATLMSASPGALGGLRGLVTVRSILGNIGTIVLPDQIAVSKANDAFNADGTLKDAKQQAGIEGLGRGLVEFLKKHIS